MERGKEGERERKWEMERRKGGREREDLTFQCSFKFMSIYMYELIHVECIHFYEFPSLYNSNRRLPFQTPNETFTQCESSYLKPYLSYEIRYFFVPVTGTY